MTPKGRSGSTLKRGTDRHNIELIVLVFQVEKYAVVEKSLQLEDSQPTTVIWPAEVSVAVLPVRLALPRNHLCPRWVQKRVQSFLISQIELMSWTFVAMLFVFPLLGQER